MVIPTMNRPLPPLSPRMHNAQTCACLLFRCPVRKVTSRGGGAALPLRPRLFGRLVAAAVRAAGPRVALTVKLRVGLDERLPTCMQVRCLSAAELQQTQRPALWLLPLLLLLMMLMIMIMLHRTL